MGFTPNGLFSLQKLKRRISNRGSEMGGENVRRCANSELIRNTVGGSGCSTEEGKEDPELV